MLRQLALNATTVAVTLAVLSAIALAVIKAVPPSPPVLAPTIALSEGSRLIGVVSDPWHVDDWDRVIGQVDITMQFSAWGRGSDLGAFIQESGRRGKIPMITWEPWSTAAGDSADGQQSGVQRRFTNAAIADGERDAYARAVAADVAEYSGPVFIRYAHEMNGFWYPWSRRPREYVAAWRHLYDLFEDEGATNAVWIWSVNTNLFQRQRAFRAGLDAYWPGKRYVDWVGSTMINFGGVKETAPGEFLGRIALLRRYHKPVMVTETNVHHGERVAWLRALRAELWNAPWVRALIWSQAPSLGGQTLDGIGDMNWSALEDDAAARILTDIRRDAGSVPKSSPAPGRSAGREVALDWSLGTAAQRTSSRPQPWMERKMAHAQSEDRR